MNAADGLGTVACSKDYKELRTEAFLALQPLGQVPVLKDRDVLLWDSGAILEWTLETHASKKLAPPPATRERAFYLQVRPCRRPRTQKSIEACLNGFRCRS